MPKCTNCNKNKPTTHFKFKRIARNSNRLTKTCKECRDKTLIRQKRSTNRIQKCKVRWEEWKRSNPCVDCGESDCRLIQADHRLDCDKVKRLGYYAWWAWHGGVEAMDKEFKKVVSRCIMCHRQKTNDERGMGRDLRSRTKTPSAQNAAIRIRRARNKKYVAQAKCDIGECYHCKKAVTPTTTFLFDFDHMDETKKRHSITRMALDGYGIKTIQKEMDKCSLLCAKCHHLKTNYGLKMGYISDENTNKMEIQQQEAPAPTPAPTPEPEILHDRFFSLQDQGIKQPEQRSPEWFEARKNKLTGSKLSQFLFIKSQDERVELYEQVFEGRKRAPFTAEQQKWVQWGCEHEDHALKVMLDNIPNMLAMEAPMVQHSTCKWIASSPDGFYELNDAIGNAFEKGCIEIKCPGKKRKANTKPTYYYVLQMYLEMACSGNDKVIFCSWGPDACRAWKLHWNDELWGMLCAMMEDLKNTKTAKALSWEDWNVLQYRLKTACHNACNEATPLFEGDGWDPQYTEKVN